MTPTEPTRLDALEADADKLGGLVLPIIGEDGDVIEYVSVFDE